MTKTEQEKMKKYIKELKKENEKLKEEIKELKEENEELTLIANAPKEWFVRPRIP